MIKIRTARGIFVSLVLIVLLVGCGSDDDSGAGIADPLALGPYPVGVTRIELFDPVQQRTLLTEVWYPADESARGQEPASAASFLPEGLEGLADNATIPLLAVRDAAISPQAPFPLIAFSHGSGGVRYQNSFQCDYLASHGYVVVAPDHQGNTFFDSSGTQGELVVARPLDIIYVLDSFEAFTAEPGNQFEGWIDTSTGIGVTGHSFGAFTSLAVADMDDRVVAAFPMALGTGVSESYDAATFLMLASEDKTIGLNGNQGVRDAYRRRTAAALPRRDHRRRSLLLFVRLPGRPRRSVGRRRLRRRNALRGWIALHLRRRLASLGPRRRLLGRLLRSLHQGNRGVRLRPGDQPRP